MAEARRPSPAFLAFLTDEASRDAVRLATGDGETSLRPGGVTEAVAHLQTHRAPEWLVVEIDSVEAAPELLNALADVCDPGTKVIVAGKVNEFSFYRWLTEMGIHSYLLEPFTAEQLKAAMKKREPQAAKMGTAAAADAPHSPGMILTFLGARGGVGTTTVAANLAWLLASVHGQKTALIDLDVHFGTLALAYDLEPSRGVGPLFENPERIDGLFLDRVMMKHSEHLSILGAEEPLKESLAGKAQAAEALLPRLREAYRFTLIDLPRSLTPMTRAVLAGSDKVIVVAEPSLASLRDTLRMHDLVKDTLARPAPLVLLNRLGQTGARELKRADFEKHYGHPVEAAIPYAAEASTATAAGEMLAASAPKSAAASALRAVAAALVGSTADADAPRRWWKRSE